MEDIMQVQIHGKPSFRKGGPASMQAQVTVLVGEGRNRYSVTRHIISVGRSWIGLNPNPQAILLNKRYETELWKAEIDLVDAKVTLVGLEKKLKNFKSVKPQTGGVNKATIELVSEALNYAIGDAKMEIETIETLVDDAKTKLAHVRRDFPLEVEFIGTGL